MISFHGSKAILCLTIMLFFSVSSLLASVLAAKSERIKLKEKQLMVLSDQLEANNSDVMRFLDYEVH